MNVALVLILKLNLTFNLFPPGSMRYRPSAPRSADLGAGGSGTSDPRGPSPRERPPAAALWRFSGETKKSSHKFAFPEKMLYLSSIKPDVISPRR